jgi:hypothetical protein
MTTALTERPVSTDGKGQRTPLGQRSKVDVDQTVLRVVGKQSSTPALDVAAFNSFAD